jgi:hypothetical protein
MGKARK